MFTVQRHWKIHFLLTLHSKFCKEKGWRCWKIHIFFSWSILLGDLPKWKTWKCFQYWFCEIHESDFNNGLVNRPVCEIHESDFNIGFIFQVITSMIKCEKTRKWSNCSRRPARWWRRNQKNFVSCLIVPGDLPDDKMRRTRKWSNCSRRPGRLIKCEETRKWSNCSRRPARW